MGWQHANAIAVLLLKLRPLLFCALYAAGQKWAAWATCIACDATAIKLVRFADCWFNHMNCRSHAYNCCTSAAHARGMEDSKAKSAVHAAGTKWHWYMLRNPFYNATVSQYFSGVLFWRLHQ
jgi:hypothetical protein